jgi:hypothetical protein
MTWEDGQADRWYENKCRALSRAVWRDQITAEEASRELMFSHEIFTRTTPGWELWDLLREASLRRRTPW